MAIIPVEKVHIVVHKSIRDNFLHKLQQAGIVHITELRETTPAQPPDLARVNEALSQLSVYKKRGVLETFVKIKRPIKFEEFEQSVRQYNYQQTVAEFERIKKERELAQTRIHHLKENIALLYPWSPLNYELKQLKSFKQTEAIAVHIPSKEKFEEILQGLEQVSFSWEEVNSIGSSLYVIFFVRTEDGPGLRTYLIEKGSEIIDFKDLSGIPGQLIAEFEKESEVLKKKIEELQKKEAELFKEVSKLELVSDLIANEHKKDEISQSLPETSSTINIIGWIKKKDRPVLEELLRKAELAVYERLEPEPDERPPIALTNSAWARPYEMLIKLYSMPSPDEYDPTPFVAIFFPLFFALCLTDAVYGIILIGLSLYLLHRVAGDRSLIWILLIGGVVTIFTGSITGGWAGDLFDKIAFKPLVDFKHSLTLFNPLENPMIFLALALGLGFIHLLLGLGIEIFDSVRNKAYGHAIFGNLTWFIFLPCLILYFTVFKSMPQTKALLEIVMWLCIVGIIVFSYQESPASLPDQLIWSVIIFLFWVGITQLIMGKFFNFHYQIQIPKFAYLLIIPALLIEIFRRKNAKKVLVKIAWGFYTLYGISTFLSVVLSYVRLMALGMVTGVIAMAINVIAWMLIKIPFVGVVVTILILIGGHIFNMVINSLGGFIHTMRLQYIEFFGRFYTGGSRPFRPFGYETKYVEFE